MATIGEKIYNNRKRIGLSQDELAERVGVSRQTISKWEMNTSLPNAENIKALASLFEIRTDSLLLPGEEIEEVVATSDVMQSKEKSNKKHFVLLVIALCLDCIAFLLSVLITVMYGFTFFSSNIGDDYISTKKVDSSLFIIALILALLFLLGMVLLICFIIRKKRKMQSSRDKM